MKREQVLLLAAVAILGLIGWSRFSAGTSTARPHAAALPLDLPAPGPEDAVVKLGAARGRDPFREPREEEPLDPLVMPLPPLDDLAAVLPPPIPDSGAGHWSDHLLRTPEPLPGGLDDLIDLQGVELDGADEAGGSDPAPALSGEASYEDSYDTIRVDPITRFYGRLLGEDRYDKQQGDTIRFQEVDPRTGKERFAPRTLTGEEYESFSFAKTLRNEIELKVRALSPSPAALAERIELVEWLLDQGNQEPVAFGYAVELAAVGAGLVPDDVSAWLCLGRAWERTFKLDRAFALYARMAGIELPGPAPDLGVALEPARFARYAAPRVRMALILRRLGLEEESRALLEDGVDLSDGDPRAPLELGRLLLEEGTPGAALPHLEKAAGMHGSRSSEAALRNGLAIGRARLALGDWEGAAEAYADTRRAAAAAAGELGVSIASGEIAARYLAGRFAEAVEEARRAVAALGPAPDLLYLRGIAAAAAGEPAAEVVRDLRNAVAAAHLDAAPALAALSFWYEVQGLEDEAANALADALRLEPGLDYAVYLRARRAARAGDLQAAERDFRALLGRAPHFAAGLAELGWILHRDERYEAAEVALRRATEDAPGWAGAFLRRGMNLLLLGRLEAARAALAEAQALQTGLHVVRNALAWAANAEADLQTAIAELSFTQDVLREQEEHPQFAYARTWQERLALHYRKRRWVDPFEGRLLRQGWRLDARVGLEPRVLDGMLIIRGNHREAGRTRVTREIPAMNFVSFTGDLLVGGEHRGAAGILMSLERSGRSTWEFRVYRDRDGRLRWYTKQGAREERGEAGSLATGAPVTFSLALDREQASPVLSVTAGGREIYSESVSALRSASMPLVVGFYAETANALPVDVALDNVELIFLVNP